MDSVLCFIATCQRGGCKPGQQQSQIVCASRKERRFWTRFMRALRAVSEDIERVLVQWKEPILKV